MKAQFWVLFSTIITWYVIGSLWMTWAFFKNSFESNRVAGSTFADFFQKNKPTLLNVVFIPLAFALLCPLIFVLVHPDTVPMGMLYLTVLIDILLMCFINNINGLAHLMGWNYSLKALKIILPIGLSFHTFQSLSYVIEVYRGNQKAERHFGYYSLYVMYYPQLVAGPIERPQNLIHQFRRNHSFRFQNIYRGLRLVNDFLRDHRSIFGRA